MMALLVATFFALGALIASFVGVLSARLYTGQSFVAGRSRCDACGAPLSPLVLVPVVSYIAARGRARCCGARVSPYAPATEVLLGALFVLAYLKLDLAPALPFLLAALALLLALVLYDLAHQILPFPLLAAFVTLAAVFRFLSAPTAAVLRDHALVALAVAAFFLVVHFASRGRLMGFADAPLAFGLALLAGSAAFAGFVFSFWIGGVLGIIILSQRPRGSRMGVEVPFAPYLAAGFLLAYFTQWNPFIFAFVVALP